MNITIENITTASTADLLAFYNTLAKKEVKRFSDRKTAERRVLALLAAREEELVAAEKATEAKQTGSRRAAFGDSTAKSALHSASIAATWKDPQVAALRSARMKVMVGDLVFGSVKKAFLHFQLPLAKHIKFRGQLRDAKQLTFSHGGEEYHFKLVTE